MNVLERNELLYDAYAKGSQTVLKPSRWTKALSVYVESLVPDIRAIVDGYTEADDFYEYSPFMNEFFNKMTFITDQNIEFAIDKNNVVTINEEFDTEILPLLKREIFYSLKIEDVMEGIPSDIIFFLKLAHNEFTPISYIPTMLPEITFNELAYGDLGDPLMLMSCILGVDVELVTTDNLIVVQNEKEADMYIPSTDCVAIIPTEDVNLLSEDDVYSIVKGEKYLMLEDKPLHTYFNRVGVYAAGSTIYNIESCN